MLQYRTGSLPSLLFPSYGTLVSSEMLQMLFHISIWDYCGTIYGTIMVHLCLTVLFYSCIYTYLATGFTVFLSIMEYIIYGE